MEELINETYKLKEMLQKDERFILLETLDKEISNNEEVMLLAYKKDQASDQYSDLLKIYKDDSSEVKEARISLSKAVKDLESHELVKKYNKAFQEVRKVYDFINLELFSLLNINICHEVHKK